MLDERDEVACLTPDLPGDNDRCDRRHCTSGRHGSSLPHLPGRSVGLFRSSGSGRSGAGSATVPGLSMSDRKRCPLKPKWSSGSLSRCCRWVKTSCLPGLLFMTTTLMLPYRGSDSSLGSSLTRVSRVGVK